MQADVSTVLNFLTTLYEAKLGYSGINTAKSAVVTFISVCSGQTSMGNHPLIQRFMRGIFIARPALPKYTATWDVSLVLNYLKTQSPASSLTKIALARKLAMLFLLLSGHRGQTLHLMDIRNIQCNNQCLTVAIGDLTKTSRPGSHIPPLSLPAYEADRRLCIVTVYREYIEKTRGCRQGSHKLFLSSIKPYRPVSRDTISNWIKKVMRFAGVDCNVFSAHSVRSASTSAAVAAQVPVSTILRTAGWEREQTFAKFYNRPIGHNDQFASAILHRE